MNKGPGCTGVKKKEDSILDQRDTRQKETPGLSSFKNHTQTIYTHICVLSPPYVYIHTHIYIVNIYLFKIHTYIKEPLLPFKS